MKAKDKYYFFKYNRTIKRGTTMKRIVILLLSFILTLTLVGCINESISTTTEDEKTTTSTLNGDTTTREQDTTTSNDDVTTIVDNNTTTTIENQTTTTKENITTLDCFLQIFLFLFHY